MKKFYSMFMMLAMMFATFGLTACGDDDDDSGDNTSIVGVWKCSSANYGEWEGMLMDNTRVGDILTFNSDNSYTIKGNNNERGQYSINGNFLKFSSDGFVVEFDIIELTSTSLTIVQKEFGFRLSFKKQ